MPKTEDLNDQTAPGGDAAPRHDDATAPELFLRLTVDEVARAVRYDRPLSVAMVHVDGLAAIRAAVGVGVAEAVADDIAARLAQEVRSVDRPFRLGPSQLGLLMPETRIVHAAVAMERLREAIAAMPSAAAPGHGPTLSIGIAAVTPRRRDPVVLLMAACLELRRARSRGGNRVSAVPVERLRITLPRSAAVH